MGQTTYKKKIKLHSLYYNVILSALDTGGGRSRLVGGCVRDGLLGIKNTDIDIATSLTPDEVIDVLTNNNIKVFPTGVKFGGVTAIYRGEQFEITTLRRDIKCDGRHSEVKFTRDFKEDAARRDFTINALSYDPATETIYDYFGGMDHLKARKVIFIGQAHARIKEDYLRILRFFRFSAIYGDKIDEAGLRACIELKENITKLAGERIKDEFDKLLARSMDAKVEILSAIEQSAVMRLAWPPLKVNFAHLRGVDEFAGKLGGKAELAAKYAVIFANTTAMMIDQLVRLKFSRKESVAIKKMVDFIIRAHKLSAPELIFVLKKLWFLENKSYLQYIICGVASGAIEKKIAQDFIGNYKNKPLPLFPVNGNDLKAIDIQGPQIGTSLSRLQDIWIEHDFSMQKSELLSRL